MRGRGYYLTYKMLQYKELVTQPKTFYFSRCLCKRPSNRKLYDWSTFDGPNLFDFSELAFFCADFCLPPDYALDELAGVGPNAGSGKKRGKSAGLDSG